jgi:SAM-dependent methyltransferase
MYRTSATHASGRDLDLVVEMCDPKPGLKVLDVASGGGHVATRLREAGAEVVTLDPSPGMGADVLAPAEHIPFDDGSFDVVVTRLAAHHFASIGEAVGEMARVTNRVLVVDDHLYSSEEVEKAEKLRDPSHVRAYSEEEWRDLLTDAGLEVERVEYDEKELDFESWFARTGTVEPVVSQVRELLAPLTSEDGLTWRSPMVIIQARKSQK